MKTRTITISKNDIFFDVDAVTHVFSRANEGQGLQRADAVESDTGDDFNETLITRFADHRASELSESLGRFLAPDNSVIATMGSSISTSTSYEFPLKVEDAFLDELMGTLVDQMETYIAEGVVADWYGSVGEPGAAAYAQHLPVILARIKSVIVKRKFPERT
jgi:hypothetical protein